MNRRGAPDGLTMAAGAPTPPPDKRWPGWLSAAEAALYLSCRGGGAAVRRLARIGRLPKPSMHLGPASPRWSREQIDELMHGRQVQDARAERVQEWLDSVRQSGPKKARQRNH